MSVDLPFFRFPLPVQALPPLPESTVEPLPPRDDPRLAKAVDVISPLSWYTYSVLQNSDSYPSGFFSWEFSDVHMGDIVVPASGPPLDYPETKEGDYAIGWRMLCFMCPSAPDRGEPDRNRTTGYPFCDERMLSETPLVSFATLKEPELEVPISNGTDAESIMACTVELNLNSTWTKEHTSIENLYTLSSQYFVAKRALRGPESEYPKRRHRYSRFYPQGVQDEQAQMPDDSTNEDPTNEDLANEDPTNDDSINYNGPFFVPTPTTTYWWQATSTAGYGYTGSSWDSSINKDDDSDSRPKTGIIIGTMVPLIVLIALISFFCKWKREEKSLIKKSAPAPRNPDPVADERRRAGLSERRYIARRNFLAAEEAAARNLSNGTDYPGGQRGPNDAIIPIRNDPEELPPAYHNVVTNVERMEIEQRMQAEGTTPQGWPPSYRDARRAASSPISPPEPAASIPEQSTDRYPALPRSPPR